MRKFEERKYERTDRICVERSCDICGAKALRPDEWPSHCSFDVNETEIRVEVRQKEGKNYPEMGWGTEITVDLCPKCFKEKLVPWLRSEGAVVEEQKWEW